MALSSRAIDDAVGRGMRGQFLHIAVNFGMMTQFETDPGHFGTDAVGAIDEMEGCALFHKRIFCRNPGLYALRANTDTDLYADSGRTASSFYTLAKCPVFISILELY